MKIDWKTTTATAALVMGLAAFPLAASAGDDSDSAAKEVESQMTEASDSSAEGDATDESAEASEDSDAESAEASEDGDADAEQATQASDDLTGSDPGANPEIEGTEDDSSEEAN